MNAIVMHATRARVALAIIAVVLSAGFARAQEKRESTVGVPARITDLVLPGTELEVAPTDAKNPLVVRITSVHPHGTNFRYDFEWSGLDPGEFDLRSVFKRKDGSTILDLPRIPVSVRSILPAGIVMPHPPSAGRVPSIGGYRTWLVVAGIAWILGLFALLLAGRKKRLNDAALARAQPRTLAERLRPLVERAMRGEITARERAELELSLVAHWRRRLNLDGLRPHDALAQLRGHAEAGALVRSLEDWLHRPNPPVAVDVSALLTPYRDLPADAFDAPDPSRERSH